MKFRILLCLILIWSQPTQCFSAFLSSWFPWAGEFCNEYWIPANVTKLKMALQEEVFGQHIATDIIFKQLEAHIVNENPSKPLVLSLHGWTGNGKNHVAYLLAKSMYTEGTKSKYYHHYMSTVHFPHEQHAELYQDQLRNWVKGNVSGCSQSLFVFDEVDKMPLGVLDSIRAYLDYNNNVDGVDYRKSIFIFLSNTGGKDIMKTVYNIWYEGKKRREDLTIRDFERMIEKGAFNEGDGGLSQSHIIERSLIDLYVPFLPMEKKHVRLCAEKEFQKQNYEPVDMEKALQTIVDNLNYYPEGQELFSLTGCKRVAQKVGVYIADEKYKKFFQKTEL